MLQIDLQVPSLNKKYNFSLNQETLVGTIIDELVEMICQKEQCGLCDDMGELMLICLDTRKVLAKLQTLESCGLKTGNRLMLI